MEFSVCRLGALKYWILKIKHDGITSATRQVRLRGFGVVSVGIFPLGPG